jgi:predicted benzoate:H+ symporter BenE
VARRRPSFGWAAFAAALVLDVVIAVVDATSDKITLTAAFVIAPLALAIVERARVVAAVAVLSTVIAVFAGTWNDTIGTLDQSLRVAVVALGGVLAVLAASARRAAVQARARMEVRDPRRPCG